MMSPMARPNMNRVEKSPDLSEFFTIHRVPQLVDFLTELDRSLSMGLVENIIKEQT